MSGVLPVALEDATKIIGYLMLSDKEYVAIMQLHKEVPREKLLEVIREFTGRIYQRPPVRSSVKRSLRIKRVYEIKVLEINYPFVLMRIRCEHGTYVRKLIHDIGEVLGVGAHMRELRRVRTGPFKDDNTLVTMHELSEAIYITRELKDDSKLRSLILPMEYGISHLPKVVIADGAVEALTHGADLAVPGIMLIHEGIKKGDTVALLTVKGELVAIGEALMSTEQVIQSSKGIAVKTRRVIMPRGIYPRLWRRRK